MIFAAGLGTRLLPLTNRTPKALIEVGGLTLLERTIERLAAAGCDRIVVNLHHHAARITEFVEAESVAKRNAAGEAEAPYRWHGAEIFLSLEAEAPMETGGGLKNARSLFRGDRTILLHNVDVISSIDLERLARRHDETGAVATLAVNRRIASRYLLFDDSGLCGRVDSRDGSEEWARMPSVSQWRAGFTGIQAVSPGILDRVAGDGAFSIMRTYLRLAAARAPILPHDVTGTPWMDVGTPERLSSAREAYQKRS
jgi:NDP-sugar pyrophosphorylase family protein